MKTLKEQLIKLRPPQSREVWKVQDLEIRLHSEKRQDKKIRPVLVVSSNKLTVENASIINVVPLTASKKPDTLVFPIDKAYEELSNDFSPKEGSCAALQFYQPIETKHFFERCGRIEEITYNAIQLTLCTELVGYEEFDITP